MVSQSKNNKRISTHQKAKVQQKLKQHHKDVKKSLQSQTPKLEKVKEVSKDTSHKVNLLKDIAESKAKEKEMHRKRLLALNILKKNDVISELDEVKEKMLKDSSRSFVGDVKKLMDEANVIIEVLDARDPMGTRSFEAEKEIKAKNKTLVFVLNKIDLVPVDNMKAWLRYLSKEARVFPFKASCQEQARNVGGSGKSVPNLGGSGSGPAAAYGVDELVNYLKSLTKGSKAVNKSHDKLVVGVMGVPNTGKSSLINSLRRKRICEAGNTPGLTRSLQHIALDSHMTLIDSPGIILAKSSDPAEYALRNCVRVEKIDDTVSVGAAIFGRCETTQLQAIYKLAEFTTYEQFIVMLATRCCALKRGGLANVRLASVKLINDWNSGKISYCTQPPLVTGPEPVLELTAAQEDAIKALTTQAGSTIDHMVASTTVMDVEEPIDNVMDE